MVDIQWAFISILTATLTIFVLQIMLGKELGPAGLGIYTLAFTFYLIGLQFAAFGISDALTKYVPEFIDNDATIRKYVVSGMISSIISGALMGIILFLLAPFIATSLFKVPELVILIQLTAICYPFIAIQKVVLGTLNGFRRMHLYAILNIVQNVSIVIISVVMVLVFGMGVFGAVIGYVIPTIFISIISPVLIRHTLILRYRSLGYILSPGNDNIRILCSAWELHLLPHRPGRYHTNWILS